MAYRPHGHAFVNPSAPSAWGRCDRCGFIYNHKALKWQFDFRGPQLQNLRFLVCEKCYDKPQAQLKPILTTQDPVPVLNARPDSYDIYNTSNLAEPGFTVNTQTGIPVPANVDLITEDGVNLTVQPIGKPADLDPNALMPLINQTVFDVLLPVVSITANGTTTITVTTSAANNLATGSQISVTGTTDNNAMGMYSVTVLSAVAFTYQANSAIPSGGLLGANTRIVTASVGIPPQYTQIAQTGA
jgi:hypothetical protein